MSVRDVWWPNGGTPGTGGPGTGSAPHGRTALIIPTSSDAPSWERYLRAITRPSDVGRPGAPGSEGVDDNELMIRPPWPAWLRSSGPRQQAASRANSAGTGRCNSG